MRIFNTLFISCLFLLASTAKAGLSVFACEPEWGALVQELAGDKVDIYVATTAQQDPHHIEARPSLIAKIRKADLLVCTGAELEVGWLPVLLRQGSNSKIQSNARGYFMAADYITLLEKPSVLDRSLGDIHAAGNPHIQVDPHNIAKVAPALMSRLQELDAANTQYYQTRFNDFSAHWQQAMNRWEKLAAPLKGVSIAVAHRSWIYLENWLGLQEVIALEPKPGVPPSSAYLSEVVTQIKNKPVKMVIYAAYQDPKASEWLADRAPIHAIELPYTVGGDNTKNLFDLYEETIKRLLGGLQ